MSLMNKHAAKVPTEDLLDMNSFGGLYADIFPFDPTGITSAVGQQGRAGRATAMAEAIGKDPGLSVKYPLTTNLGSTFLGALIGGGLATGYDAIDHSGVPLLSTPEGKFKAIIGAGLGGLAGMLLQNIHRRGKMKDIARAYKNTPEEDIIPKLHDPALLDIFGGHHNRARQRAIAAMLGSGEGPSNPQIGEMAATGIGSIGGQLANAAIGFPGATLSALGGLTSNISARSMARKNKLRDILFRAGAPGDEALLDMLENSVTPSKAAQQNSQNKTASIKVASNPSIMWALLAARKFA